jgi:hypothetical protein
MRPFQDRCVRQAELSFPDGRGGKRQGAGRLVHFPVQSVHLHLIVEANNRLSLSRGMAGMAIRMARAVNRVLRRRGATWACRYHCRALTTPREVRNSIVFIVYVIFNSASMCRGPAEWMHARRRSGSKDGRSAAVPLERARSMAPFHARVRRLTSSRARRLYAGPRLGWLAPAGSASA